jgi:hypothetical protein
MAREGKGGVLDTGLHKNVRLSPIAEFLSPDGFEHRFVL